MTSTWTPPAAGQRVGFFTDTTVCIGCKACEVACKEWNGIPTADEAAPVAGESPFAWLGRSFDNTGMLDADHWRHVTFVEQTTDEGVRWLMNSDVCKHCTTAACLDVCPTGSLFRTEFDTVVVQPDICNGCGYCVPACPYGVIDRRESDGRAWKCTLCYDRLKVGQEPACAKACPTDSINVGVYEDMVALARGRLAEVVEAGVEGAQLYGEPHADGAGVDGAGSLFLLLDDPSVYRLPVAPRAATKDLPALWRAAGAAAAILVGAVGFAVFGGRSR